MKVDPSTQTDRSRTSVLSTIAWTIAAAVAVLWPARITGMLDGAPLDGRAEALVIGLLLPALWWAHRSALATTPVRGLIVLLGAWKLALVVMVTPTGLCAATFAPAPLDGVNMGIPIVEPSGALRSWDVRADWRAPRPQCTAILTRPLGMQTAFPAWYLNVTDLMLGGRDFTMTVRGWITIPEARTLTVEIDRDVQFSGLVGGAALGAGPLTLPPGSHYLDATLRLTGNAWRFEPRLDGEALWDAALVTTGQPTKVDRWLSGWARWVTPAIVSVFIGAWVTGLIVSLGSQPAAAWTWLTLAPLAAIALARWGDSRWHRAAGLMTMVAAVVPVAMPLRNLRGAFLLVGLPWLAFFAALSFGQIGHFSIYSYDDWLTYQVAGLRIFMHGYWLEGGNVVFDFQPLYRWMTGALHVIFGDSSVGEMYWDAACLLIGALLAFQLVRPLAGFRAGVAAAAATLATYTLGTTWYFPGRGLSEIAAAGWGFLAMFFLLRAKAGSLAWAAAAAVAAVLMFYTRLNHLLLPVFLLALLLPRREPFNFRSLVPLFVRVRRLPAVVFAAGFTIGVLAFMWRTWHYTGVFSLFYGTSLRHNDTGLRPWTIFSGEAWGKVAHSLGTLVFMNDPPRPDPRAMVMMLGALVLIAAVLQLPTARRLPAALVIVAAGSSAAAFLAHAHGYPGRFSLLSVPFASALGALWLAGLRQAEVRP
jgi:hypothetical protein